MFHFQCSWWHWRWHLCEEEEEKYDDDDAMYYDGPDTLEAKQLLATTDDTDS